MNKHTLAQGLMLSAALVAAPLASAMEASLVTPKVIIADQSLSKATLAANELAARRYDSFWNTGDEALARLALSPTFVDRTLPPGRVQGVDGPLEASRGFRQAVPDLACEVEQMLLAGDRVVAHLHFTGHFTGAFKGVQGKGQTVDFIATDIYRVVDGRIAENWHLEDNYTLLSQLGVIH